MNPEVKEKWVNALRSGEYKQCRNTLRKPDTKGFNYKSHYRHCCLGVLSDLFVPEVKWKGMDYIEGLEGSYEKDYLHSFVVEKAGFEPDEIEDGDPRVPRSVDIEGDNGKVKHVPRGTTLSKLNDNVNYSFEEIAKVIEKAF